MSIAGRTAIVGVGASSFARDPNRSVIEMAGHALNGALADAGLEKAAIDGLIVHVGSPRGADYDTIAQTFGLEVGFCSQTWAHGRFTATVIAQAAMAIVCGFATRVACILAMKNSDIGRIGEAANPFFHEQFRENGGPHGEEAPIGMSSPVAGAAMGFDLYRRRYAKDRELLAEIPMTFRRHALLNPDAVAGTPMSLADYQAAPLVVDPLRRFDCSLVGDGAVCLIVTARAVAPAGQRVACITGFQGVQAGRETFIFAPRGLGFGQQSTRRLTSREARGQLVYGMAGCVPETIDILGAYDSFSPLPLYTYEDFGFCGAGDALDWIQGGRIGLGGDLPTNTNGGQLSHAQLNGWGQLRELVLQLRGEATGRQVEGAAVAMWASCCGDAMILQGI